MTESVDVIASPFTQGYNEFYNTLLYNTLPGSLVTLDANGIVTAKKLIADTNITIIKKR